MGLFDAFKKQVKEEEVKRNPLMDLLETNGIDISNITLDGTSGDVTLSGSSEDGAIIEKAVELLQNVPNVSSVTNSVELADLSDRNIRLTVTTKGSNLNVRAGSSTDHDILGKYPNGTEVTLVKRINANWNIVRTDELEGYCHTDYLAQSNPL